MSENGRPYIVDREQFKDAHYEQAVQTYPVDSVVYIVTTGQLGKVKEVRATADGPRIRVANIGSVPIDELRVATDEDIAGSRYEKYVEKRGGQYFF